MSLVHDHCFGEMSFVWPLLVAPVVPPESPPRFRLWRDHLFGCKRRLHLLKLFGNNAESARALPLATLQHHQRVSR